MPSKMTPNEYLRKFMEWQDGFPEASRELWLVCFDQSGYQSWRVQYPEASRALDEFTIGSKPTDRQDLVSGLIDEEG